MKVAIVGSGIFGKNLARALAARGDQVTVLSNHPVDLPALWRRCDALSGDGLRRGVQGAEALIFTAAAQHPPGLEELPRQGARHAISAAAHHGIERVLLVGPNGARADARAASLRAHHEGTHTARRAMPGLRVLRLPPLFGPDDALLTPWLEEVRHGRPFPVRDKTQELRPLFVGDAVRVALELLNGGRELMSLQGPERLSLDALAGLVCRRFDARRALWPFGGPDRPEDRARLPEQLDAPDDWATLNLGERTPVAEYLDRWSRQHYGG